MGQTVNDTKIIDLFTGRIILMSSPEASIITVEYELLPIL